MGKLTWDEWTKSSEAKYFREFEIKLENYIRITDLVLHNALQRTGDYRVAYGIEFLIRFVCVEKDKKETFKFSIQGERGRDKMNLVFLIIMKGFVLGTLSDLGVSYADVKNGDDWLSHSEVQADLKRLEFSNSRGNVYEFIKDWNNKKNRKNYTWKCKQVVEICDDLGIELFNDRFGRWNVEDHLEGTLKLEFRRKLDGCETIYSIANNMGC